MTTITCPRCGASAPYGAPGCLGCGVAFVPPPHPGASQAAVPSKSGFGIPKKVLVIGGTLVALVAIGLAGGFFGPRLSDTTKSKEPILAAKGSSSATTAANGSTESPSLAEVEKSDTPNLSQVVASSTSPLSEAATTTETLATPSAPSSPALSQVTGMPQDIHDWLDHLRKTEAQRSALSQSQITSAYSTLMHMQAQKIASAADQDPSDDPGAELRNEASGQISSLRASWVALKAGFDSMVTPAECSTAKAEYDQTLTATGQMMVELITAINQAAQHPEAALSALRGMQGTSGSRIDTHSKATDSEVANICGHYQTPKWFSIASDIGDSGILSKIGID